MDPLTVTNFDRTDEELEQFWLYGILAAGKNSDWVCDVLPRLLHGCDEPAISWLGNKPDLEDHLVSCRSGQYGRIMRSIRESSAIDLRIADIEELQAVHGVGPKTCRFFALHSRKDCVDCAALDRHILSWMRDCGVDAPEQTPTYLPKYLRLEQECILLQREHYPHMTLAQSDLFLWAKFSGRLEDWRRIYGSQLACYA
jgi:hypothetical protein